MDPLVQLYWQLTVLTRSESVENQTKHLNRRILSQIIAYISVTVKEIQMVTSMTAVFEDTKMKPKTPNDVARVDSAIASFPPKRASRAAPTSDPGKLCSTGSQSCSSRQVQRADPAIVYIRNS